ncbi:vomeronasal type-2 receptor 1-like [Pygocentrus nattereri]|uniref:vomeronasal type-2 receptor 1-like n=1 Tax=Pygocentrus nattereri TaxID=42514 RepID=UPI0018913B24|nr:vomeronasal type-2 receptor 1-like [Pygocentrus nattereri]
MALHSSPMLDLAGDGLYGLPTLPLWAEPSRVMWAAWPPGLAQGVGPSDPLLGRKIIRNSKSALRKYRRNSVVQLSRSTIHGMDFRELHVARAMEFTTHEINKRTDLLPGITLGYQIRDPCASIPMAIKLAYQLANGVESVFNHTDSRSKSASAAVPAVIGESGSTPSVSMARLLVSLEFHSMDFRELRIARAMEFTTHEINNRTDLLPGITLGYQIRDSCAAVQMSIKATFQLANGVESVFNDTDSCSKSASAAVPAVIGESGSTPSVSMARLLGLFGIPQVSHYATCTCLSDKLQYPAFFRTIPSDHHQAAALAKLVKHFGWTWIGAVRSDSDYGNYGMASFLKAAQEEGICVEYSESYYRTQPRSKLERVANVIRRSTARVIVAFLAATEMRVLMEELARQPPPHLQWIGSETWITQQDLLKYNMCAGAIGFGIPRSVIPGFREFLLDLSPAQALKSPLLTEFWESSFSCSLKGSSGGARECNGSEDIRALQNPYTDTSQLRITNMVYKATYAIAHAIHGVICNDTQCDKSAKFTPWQILSQLKRVNFTTKNGFQVTFDSNGDPVAIYELINWQVKKDGLIDFVTIGRYDSSKPRGQEFSISNAIIWLGGQTEVPVSVCSESCPPGTRKAVQKGKPVCCYDCIPCAEGEISNKTDSLNCVQCPHDFWPNVQRDSCLPKPVEFLSWDDTLSIILTVFSIAGALISACVAAVFCKHKTSPIVRANNSELSFLLLFSLTLCFLCSLTFIGQPSEWSCMLRHTAFGITFVLCISCVLGKTMVVLMAFRATLPGSDVMKWFGPPQQRLSVLTFTLIQVKKNTCLWPPHKQDEIVKVLRSQEPPGAHWIPYGIHIILSKV